MAGAGATWWRGCCLLPACTTCTASVRRQPHSRKRRQLPGVTGLNMKLAQASRQVRDAATRSTTGVSASMLVSTPRPTWDEYPASTHAPHSIHRAVCVACDQHVQLRDGCVSCVRPRIAVDVLGHHTTRQAPGQHAGTRQRPSPHHHTRRHASSNVLPSRHPPTPHAVQAAADGCYAAVAADACTTRQQAEGAAAATVPASLAACEVWRAGG